MASEDYVSRNNRLDDDPLYSISFENARLEEENKNLKRTVQFYQTELEKFRTPPFIVSEILSITDEKKAIIKLPNQSNFLVEISQSLKKELHSGDMVLNEQKSLVIIDKIDLTKNFPVENFLIVDNKPKETWNDIGGLSKEIELVREVLELPLTKPEVFKEIGISPPKGVLLNGPPGTGKTMIAKALAKETNATFIELVGSELVQKFIGEGAKLVKDLFELARKKAPTIIFIDEIDAIAAKRIETGTSGEREVQRTFMQLLGEIDGFDALSDVKIIAATNRIDILDEAILRAGRLERHITVGKPDEAGRLEILRIHTRKMKLHSDINLDEIAKKALNFSGADLKALVTEAGYCAIRNNRKRVVQDDMLSALEKVKKEEESYNMLSQTFL
ncbi:AAA family ATPase [Candidatus Woesearchaeota archaeon]|nr:AAA family ATPase [Nanoarchaeota archaeon]MCB9370680.1 AAA family ATPase [Candidatus Woesearchaeota archaeon]USN43764.1 MAG: AAA family ATPase [Candidatus Woesearchaeota archaeon]